MKTPEMIVTPSLYRSITMSTVLTSSILHSFESALPPTLWRVHSFLSAKLVCCHYGYLIIFFGLMLKPFFTDWLCCGWEGLERGLNSVALAALAWDFQCSNAGLIQHGNNGGNLKFTGVPEFQEHNPPEKGSVLQWSLSSFSDAFHL